MSYFKTNHVRPTKEDTNFDGCILAWNSCEWQVVHYTALLECEDKEDDLANFYTYWMQMPKAPDSNGKEF